MNTEPIQLLDHQHDWSRLFDVEAALLSDTLADGLHAVHHVGSTAVSGIRAKPIVDISVESLRYPPDRKIVNTLKAIGYQPQGESGVVGRFWFTKGEPRAINLHWCPVNGDVVRAQLRFLDALNSNLSLAKRYEQLKIEAAHGQLIDSSLYAEAKSKFIASVLGRLQQ